MRDDAVKQSEKELRNIALIIDVFITAALLAVYREDYSLGMLLLTQPIALGLAVAWQEMVPRAK